jgi:GT2 family glycosyltransferase
MVSISIVSHCQVRILNLIIADILRYLDADFELIITHNVAEHASAEIIKSKKIVVIHNSRPQGFGANHNAAFQASSGDFFCVLNPDIRLNSNLSNAFAVSESGRRRCRSAKNLQT